MVTTAGLQRAAQARRGAAGAPRVRLRHHRAGEGARHHPVAHPPLPVPPGPAAARCASTWSGSAPQEGVTVDARVLPLVVRAGGGSARDSLSVLDQLLAGAGPGGRHLRAARSALLGVTDVALLDDVVDALAAGDGAAVFETVDRVVEAGHDPRRFAADLLERLRDLIVLAPVPGRAASRPARRARRRRWNLMRRQAARLGRPRCRALAEIVHAGLIRDAGHDRAAAAARAARAPGMLLPAGDDSESGVLARRTGWSGGSRSPLRRTARRTRRPGLPLPNRRRQHPRRSTPRATRP